MKLNEMRIAVLGCGTMGRAIVGGLLSAQLMDPRQITITRRDGKKAAAIANELGVVAHTDNLAAIDGAAMVLLCVKPQMVQAVLTEEVSAALAGKVVISIAAGITLKQLATWLPQSIRIRAMPNTPGVIGEGMTVLSPDLGVSDEQLQTVVSIFTAVGRCRVLHERHLDAVTGLSGSGPAFVCVLLEALADGGVMMGLPRDVAIELAAQTMQGTARLVLKTGMHPAALKDEVTTPAGCTIAGLLTMEDRGIRATLARTIQEAAKVASGLGSTE